MSIKTTNEHLARLSDAIAEIENNGPGDNYENLINLRSEAATVRTHVISAWNRAQEAARALDAHQQPTADERAKWEAVLSGEAPDIAIFGETADLPADDIAAARVLTGEELAAKDRTADEERIYSAVAPRGDISILDVEDARIEVARTVVAAELADALALDNDRSVTSKDFADLVSRQARHHVNTSLDQDYGAGTAKAINDLRPMLEADRNLRKAETAHASEPEIHEKEGALFDAMRDTIGRDGEQAVAVAINRLPEPQRSDLAAFYGERVPQMAEQQAQGADEQSQDSGLTIDLYSSSRRPAPAVQSVAPTSTIFPELDQGGRGPLVLSDAARQDITKQMSEIQADRRLYESDPVARQRFDELGANLDARFINEAKTYSGVIPKHAVEERWKIYEIQGNSEMANHLRAVLDAARQENRELTISDLDPDHKQKMERAAVANLAIDPARKIRNLITPNGREPVIRERDEVGASW